MHIATVQGGPFESQVDPSVTLHRIEAVNNYDPLIAARIARLIRRLRPDLVQTWLPQMDVLGGAAALAARARWVISEQSSALEYRSDWRYTLRQLIGRWATGIVANSQAGVDWWRDKNSNHEFHRVVPNMTLMSPPADVTAAPREPSQKPRILYIGRLVEQKRLAKLVAALAIVRGRLDFEGVICGDGHLASDLRKQAESLGLAGVVDFAGWVTDVPKRLRESDVFVSVSAFEGMPNAVEEAMVCGTPVVLSDIPEHREIADEHCAVFVDGSDPDSIACGIIESLTDRERAAARAGVARERALKSSAGAAAAWSNYYRQLIDGPRVGRSVRHYRTARRTPPANARR